MRPRWQTRRSREAHRGGGSRRGKWQDCTLCGKLALGIQMAVYRFQALDRELIGESGWLRRVRRIRVCNECLGRHDLCTVRRALRGLLLAGDLQWRHAVDLRTLDDGVLE